MREEDILSESSSSNPDSIDVSTAGVVEPITEFTAPYFFAVSLPKLIVMSFVTLGFYQWYWFYRNWQNIVSRDGSRKSPFWRACLNGLFGWPCFAEIGKACRSNQIEMLLPTWLLGLAWTITALLSKFDALWPIALGAVAILLPVQVAANRVNRLLTPNCDPNDRFSSANWFMIAFGLLLWAALST
jgi:hypothetical protein